MARNWLVRAAAVAVLLASVGCRSWCDRHYGNGCCYAPSASPQCCCPPPQCCCPPTTNYAPPPPAPVGTWNQPRGCTCP